MLQQNISSSLCSIYSYFIICNKCIVAAETLNYSATNFKIAMKGVFSGTLSTLYGSHGSDISVILKETFNKVEPVWIETPHNLWPVAPLPPQCPGLLPPPNFYRWGYLRLKSHLGFGQQQTLDLNQGLSGSKAHGFL